MSKKLWKEVQGKKKTVWFQQALKRVNYHNLLIVIISHNLIQAAIKHHQWLEGSYLFEPSLASHANLHICCK